MSGARRRRASLDRFVDLLDCLFAQPGQLLLQLLLVHLLYALDFLLYHQEVTSRSLGITSHELLNQLVKCLVAGAGRLVTVPSQKPSVRPLASAPYLLSNLELSPLSA